MNGSMAIPYGIDIMPSEYWPKDKPVMGTFVSKAHPFVEWLSRFFRFDPNTYFDNVEIGKTWNDPIVFDRGMIEMFSKGGKVLVCSYEQAEQIKELLGSGFSVGYWRGDM